MVNLLFRVVGALLVFVLIVMLVGSLLPRQFETSTSVVIQASPKQVFPHVNTIKKWANWSMWNPQDVVDLKIEYSGEPSGVGAVQKWTEVRGEGKMWITESLENQLIKYRSRFAGFPEMESSIQFTGVDNGTRVEWSSAGSLPSGPFYGWFGLTFADSLAGLYNKSLARLKNQVEATVNKN